MAWHRVRVSNVPNEAVNVLVSRIKRWRLGSPTSGTLRSGRCCARPTQLGRQRRRHPLLNQKSPHTGDPCAAMSHPPPEPGSGACDDAGPPDTTKSAVQFTMKSYDNPVPAGHVPDRHRRDVPCELTSHMGTTSLHGLEMGLPGPLLTVSRPSDHQPGIHIIRQVSSSPRSLES